MEDEDSDLWQRPLNKVLYLLSFNFRLFLGTRSMGTPTSQRLSTLNLRKKHGSTYTSLSNTITISTGFRDSF